MLRAKSGERAAVVTCSFMSDLPPSLRGAVRDGDLHAWQERAAPGSSAALMSWRAHHQPRRPVRAALRSPPGGADLFTISRAALHKDLWPDARAIGDCLGRAERMDGNEPGHCQTPITVEDVLVSQIIAYPFVTRTQYPGIQFPATEPFWATGGQWPDWGMKSGSRRQG
jgi:hypothetical protein